MSESQNSGRTEQDLSPAGQAANAEAMATFVMPAESSESPAPGGGTPQASPAGTVIMDGPADAVDTQVIPPPDSSKTFIGPTDQTIGDGPLQAGAIGPVVAVKGYRILGELGRPRRGRPR